MNSPESAVFHKGKELYGLFEARRSGQSGTALLVVEGYMDVVMLAQHGIREAVATLGTALSAAHLTRLFRQSNEVIFCFDGDEAGRRAAQKALQLSLPAMEDGREVRFLFLPEGEDPDSLVRQRGADAFRALLRGATPLSEQLFAELGQDLDLDELDGRARLAKAALPLLARIPGVVFRSLMLDELANRSGVRRDELQSLADGARDLVQQSERPKPVQRSTDQPARRRVAGLSLVERAIVLLLYRPNLAASVAQPAALAGLNDPDAALLAELAGLLHDNPDATLGTLLGYWYGSENGSRLARLAATEVTAGAEAAAAEFADLLAEFDRRLDNNAAEARRRELEQLPFDQLNAEQKRQYLELVRRGESK